MKASQGPARLILDSIGTLLRRPFLIILLLDLGATAVSVSISTRTDPNTANGAALVLTIISLYLQIAIILAAAATEPEKSGDLWLRAALARRIFWRYLGGSLLAYISISLAGAAAALAVAVFGAPLWLVMIAAGAGALWMGSIVGLAPQAVALERATPVEALSISTIISREDRRQVGIVFGLLFVVPVGSLLGVTEASAAESGATTGGPGWWNLLAVTATTAGTIALTRLYPRLRKKAKLTER